MHAAPASRLVFIPPTALLLGAGLLGACAHDDAATSVPTADDTSPADGAAASPAADTAAASQPARSYELVDATGAFFAFWDKHEHDPVPAQVDAFIDEVVGAHPDLYAAHVIGLPKDKPYDEALRERVTLYLPRAQPHLGAIRAARRDLDANLSRYEASFLATFDDFAYTGRIIIMGSVGGFDGATRQIGGDEVLLFGVDGIALYHPPGSDLAPFFHHELFHLYHRQALIEQGVDVDDEQNIAMALWGEGLAVYVSERLNAGASFDDLLLSEDMVKATDARMADLTTELAANLASSDEQLYATYFLGAGGDRVPKRCGYYLGLRVAQKIGEGRTLKQLARLHGDELKQHIAEALDGLGTQPDLSHQP